MSPVRTPEPVATPAPRTISRRVRDSSDAWETVSAPAPARLALNVGDLVRHSAFGEGVVTGWEPDASDVQVTVEFRDGVGVKRLLLSFAPLEKIEG